MTAAVAFQPEELFWPDNFLPSQIDRGRALSGPHALIYAIVENAINCICSAYPISSARKYRLAKEALDWILSEEDHLFSFLFCCQHLAVDPSRVRKAANSVFAKLTHPDQCSLNKALRYTPVIRFNKLRAGSRLPAWLSSVLMVQPGKRGRRRTFTLREYSYTKEEAERIAREYIRNETWELQK